MFNFVICSLTPFHSFGSHFTNTLNNHIPHLKVALNIQIYDLTIYDSQVSY